MLDIISSYDITMILSLLITNYDDITTFWVLPSVY
jgi:hypothetical protein